MAMTVTNSKVHARRQKVFRSVFETRISQPTPLLPATEPGQPFGGPSAAFLANTPRLTHPANDQVRWDRAWHVVTSRIQLPSSVAAEDSFGTLAPDSSQDVDDAFRSSLLLVLNPASALPNASHTEDILSWHSQQVRQHFVNHVLPLLAACTSQGDHTQVLLTSIRTLEAANRQYLYGLSLILRAFRDEDAANAAVVKFRRDLHAVIGNSWTQGLLDALRDVFNRLATDVLRAGDMQASSPEPDREEDSEASDARGELLRILESLSKVGLAGEKFQTLFAEVMNSCMDAFIQRNYAGVWTSSDDFGASTVSTVSSGCMAHLSDWVENHYARLTVEVFSRMGSKIEWSDVEMWKNVAIGRLSTLRIHELFDIVLSWPESKGGVEDLRSAVTTPQRRLQLTDTFSAALQKRLLQPGRSTLYILQTYISMIRTFHSLDHSKVLLDRVVHALQLYLCQRDDAIRIVVTGLLSHPKETTPEDSRGKLVELAAILNDASLQQRRHVDDDDLDWNDMHWLPDPVDAGVNYKRPKNEDVIGTLISALGSSDIFIKEFQSIIATRLLSGQASIQQEVKVLGLLKRRFGESALQNCDVMLRDIQDSKRVDAAIGKSMELQQDQDGNGISFHSKILSRLFWPSLPKEPFTVPETVAEMQRQYEASFEHLKSSRKLNWLDNLGLATVHLELEDRTLTIECKTYEATVIYAFGQDEAAGEQGPVKRAFNDLWQKLMIDEDLLEEALAFWVSQRVIRDIGERTYVVLEKLEDDVENAGAEAAQGTGEMEGGPPSPRKAKGMSAKEQEQRGIYWQFIVGMLTNSSPAMPLAQMMMMMKMLIPDGCSWSNEELQDFLEEKIAAGELELAGGKYRLPKK
ncbi:unnamed protein product [Clonostachys rosea f. rosea IK726]|jgi:anaphase-promoting complex subunit 2|uniref:Anaphase-promoting complex subunit 2 n=3 Tax=Bionectria ochroleuca TaxID=29856 RepID=A0A8H7TP20_BIOOC|nr:unnamed protein product [Clonostachys rosea f. rosea IK726]